MLDGELEFRLGEETFTASAGATVFVPPRLARVRQPHRCARAIPADPVPARPDRYFDELAAILAVEGPPDSEAIAELRRRYDTEQLSSLTAGRT